MALALPKSEYIDVLISEVNALLPEKVSDIVKTVRNLQKVEKTKNQEIALMILLHLLWYVAYSRDFEDAEWERACDELGGKNYSSAVKQYIDRWVDYALNPNIVKPVPNPPTGPWNYRG
jgi:hypothetical protein